MCNDDDGMGTWSEGCILRLDADVDGDSGRALTTGDSGRVAVRLVSVEDGKGCIPEVESDFRDPGFTTPPHSHRHPTPPPGPRGPASAPTSRMTGSVWDARNPAAALTVRTLLATSMAFESARSRQAPPQEPPWR